MEMSKRELLRTIGFGHRVAEDETDDLSTYFVETDSWDRLLRGDIDIVYGAKGAGKSALYALLISRSDQLFDRNVLLAPAENPRGAPAFRDLLTEPPASENEFVGLWKLYFTSLLHGVLQEYLPETETSKKLTESLAREGLVKGKMSLAGLLKSVGNYVRRYFEPHAVEGGMNVDHSGAPTGFTGKIIFSEPGNNNKDPELRSVDGLLELAAQAFADEKYTVWIVLDRLDVAFAENSTLEVNALRALFRVYLDLRVHPAIQIKIFLRTDIWKRITASGFREASHITKHVTISWNRNSLLNLLVRRAVHNKPIQDAYGMGPGLASQSVTDQEHFFYRICPAQVDEGERKPTTLDWLLTRTADGTKSNAPREFIHLMNSLREEQVKRLEVGDPDPAQELLFARGTFKEALPEVSKVRLEQTLYAEHPEMKFWLEKLRGEKTLQSLGTLAEVWSESAEVTASRASQLVEVGFFEERGPKENRSYWVPFLYRDALELIQGAAD
jgi:hypothetical protein